MKPEFAVSLMCMDLLNVKEQLNILNKRADMYHMDIMDGHYCKNITLSPDFVKACATATDIPMDAHLMTENPNDWIELLAAAGARYISPHAETINKDAFRTMNRIRDLGCLTGIVLNPATTLDSIRHYLPRLDMITIMTVDVGFAGQPFIAEMLGKIEEAAEFKVKEGLTYKIQIDGSCNEKTFKQLRDAGAEVFILGTSGLFGLDRDLNISYEKMLQGYTRVTGEQV